jgi:hypothetical protein
LYRKFLRKLPDTIFRSFLQRSIGLLSLKTAERYAAMPGRVGNVEDVRDRRPTAVQPQPSPGEG